MHGGQGAHAVPKKVGSMIVEVEPHGQPNEIGIRQGGAQKVNLRGQPTIYVQVRCKREKRCENTALHSVLIGVLPLFAEKTRTSNTIESACGSPRTKDGSNCSCMQERRNKRAELYKVGSDKTGINSIKVMQVLGEKLLEPTTNRGIDLGGGVVVDRDKT